MRPPTSTRTDTIFPNPTLFRSRFLDLFLRPRTGHVGARNARGRVRRLDQGTHGPRLCRVEIGRVERPRPRSAAMIPVPPAIQRIPWKLIAILAGITGLDRKSTRLNSSH